MYTLTPAIREFNDFWASLHADEVAFPNRKAATLALWQSRTPAARKALKNYIEEHGAMPRKRNPFFWVMDFPEPKPTNLNGKSIIHRLMQTTPLVSAQYQGEYGIYTLEEAQMHSMTIVRGLNFDYENYIHPS